MFKEKIKINFYDCDPAGILFYANLFRIAHKAYEGLIESFNLPGGYFENEKFVVPIIHTEGNYLKPLKTGCEIEIKVKVSQLRTSSFELAYDFLDKENTLYADVKTVHVFVNKSNFEKTAIPEEILTHLESNQD